MAGSAADNAKPVALAPVENHRQYFAAPSIAGREDDFCRRAYRIMLKGAAFCGNLYHEWPHEPDAGYLGWGGQNQTPGTPARWPLRASCSPSTPTPNGGGKRISAGR
ncbi:MAG: hypothetical protein JW829_07680 [Pirellulales bacterium]|nr:hypothetical protein [Pirellulales bacterium]